jgi:hypothetical protein
MIPITTALLGPTPAVYTSARDLSAATLAGDWSGAYVCNGEEGSLNVRIVATAFDKISLAWKYKYRRGNGEWNFPASIVNSRILATSQGNLDLGIEANLNPDGRKIEGKYTGKNYECTAFNLIRQ